MALEALIFDVDGTLAETEELHRLAFNDAFAAAGLAWAWDPPLYGRLLDVTGGKERMRHYIDAHGGLPALDAPAIAALHRDKTARYTALVAGGGIAFRPGVLRLMDEARDAGLRIAIATTTSPANVEALLRAALGPDGPARFAAVAAGDVVRAKKPAPDIYHLALEQLGLPARACLALEDTPNGLRAALGAGIATVVTTSLYGGTEDFEGALAVVNHLGEPGDPIGEPGEPCRVLRGPPLIGDCVTLAELRRWLDDAARPE